MNNNKDNTNPEIRRLVSEHLKTTNYKGKKVFVPIEQKNATQAALDFLTALEQVIPDDE